MARQTHRERCPECERAITDGSNHEVGCFYEGVDALGLDERKESWAKESRFEARRLEERGR